MRPKKRPILTVFIVLTALALVLGAVAFFLSQWLAPGASFFPGQRLGVVEIEGLISNSRRYTQQLARFRKDTSIKAVILRIDSPGGVVGPSQEIHREVRKLAAIKPVIASLGAVAASGGYYVACAATQIVANPGTLTGSIGALMEFVNVQDLLRKLGVRMDVLKSGEYKDLGSPHRRLTKRERAMVQELVGDIRRQFVAAVAAGRDMPAGQVDELADGRIISGERALGLGLVDRLGNFEDAVEAAKKEAGIEGEVELVFGQRKRLRIWEMLLDRLAVRLEQVLGAGSSLRPAYLWRGLSGAVLRETG